MTAGALIAGGGPPRSGLGPAVRRAASEATERFSSADPVEVAVPAPERRLAKIQRKLYSILGRVHSITIYQLNELK
jgi:hypothetical protein